MASRFRKCVLNFVAVCVFPIAMERDTWMFLKQLLMTKVTIGCLDSNVGIAIRWK